MDDLTALLIEIYVGASNDNGKIATGYPIAKDHILTAWHSIKSAKDEPQQIQVRWPHQTGTACQWHRIEEIAWSPEGVGLDVVILRCKFPTSISRYGYLSVASVPRNMQWNGQGFAEAEQRPHAPSDSAPLAGRILEHSNSLKLGVDYAVSNPKHYRGISGAPVMVGPYLVGVVKSVPDAYVAKQLRATPISACFDDDRFKALPFLDRAERLAAVRLQIDRILKDASDVRALLAQALGLDKVEGLSEVLVNSSVQQFMSALDDVCEQLVGDENFQSLRVLKKLFLHTIPPVFGATLSQFRKERLGPGLIALPTDTETVAELVMAEFKDEREARFKDLKKGEFWPVGSLRIPPWPPNLHTAMTIAESVTDHLIDEFVDSRNAERYKAYRPRLIEVANNRLRRYSTKKKTTYYLTIVMPDAQDERQHIKGALEELGKRFSALPILELNRSVDFMVDYEGLFDPVRDILAIPDQHQQA